MLALQLDSGRLMRGGQWQVLGLLEGLREHGVDSVLLAAEASPLYERASRAGLDVRPLTAASVWRLSRQACLTHAHDARSHTLGALFSSAPLLVSRRVAFPLQRGILSQWKYRRAAHYLAISACVRQTLADARVPQEKISIVYDGVSLAEPSPRGHRIVAPATEDPQKGSALVREAAARAEVEVHFSDDLAADLRDAAMLVYISHQEGLGSGALLAMAQGVPVIASRLGGLTEAVEHEKTGLLVENDPEAIAAAIQRLVADRQAADEMGERGRCRVRERFSLARMVHDTLAVYERILP